MNPIISINLIVNFPIITNFLNTPTSNQYTN
jgi:hypothetical protein